MVVDRHFRSERYAKRAAVVVVVIVIGIGIGIGIGIVVYFYFHFTGGSTTGWATILVDSAEPTADCSLLHRCVYIALNLSTTLRTFSDNACKGFVAFSTKDCSHHPKKVMAV